MMNNIKQVIELKGCNEYREGREAYKRCYKRRRRLDKLLGHVFLNPRGDSNYEESERDG